MNFCNQHGLRPGDLKTADLAGQSLEGTGLLLERGQANNLGAKSVDLEDLKSTPGTQWGEYSL